MSPLPSFVLLQTGTHNPTTAAGTVPTQTEPLWFFSETMFVDQLIQNLFTEKNVETKILQQVSGPVLVLDHINMSAGM